jgi:hypothetical protein
MTLACVLSIIAIICGFNFGNAIIHNSEDTVSRIFGYLFTSATAGYVGYVCHLAFLH